jgi:hypothetical protein
MSMNSIQPKHLVLDYRPSEWTGWEWGKTIGGHDPSKQFTLAGTVLASSASHARSGHVRRE